jgi:hypothetical protein
MRATPADRDALLDMHRLMASARGDHAALASARQQIAVEIDARTSALRLTGVDVDALLDEIDQIRAQEDDERVKGS